MHDCQYKCTFPITDINKDKQVFNQCFSVITAVFCSDSVYGNITLNIIYNILIAVISQKS